MTPWLLWFFLLAPQEATPQICSISGTVVDSVTGATLPKARLWLEPLGRGSNPVATTTSDARGRFAMVDLAPGKYRLKGQRGGYLESAYGGGPTGGDGAAITLNVTEPPLDLKVALRPAGVIAGTVRDSDGEPFSGGYVVLARRKYRNGRAEWVGEDSQDANDLGEYRFASLAPGKYTISVQPPSRGWNRIDRSAPSAERVYASVPTAYPGVSDVGVAGILDVQAGARLTGIDITMLRSPVYKVSGVVVGAGTGVAVQFHADFRDFGLRTGTRNAAGEFEMRGVPPGSYILRANGAALPLQVTGDIEGVRLLPVSNATVRGRVTSDGDAQTGMKADVWLAQQEQVRSVRVDETGAFTASDVPPGHYTVEVHRGSPETYVKRIASHRTDVLREGLDISGPGEIVLEIVLACDGGQAEGVVTGKDGHPVPGATAALIPESGLRGRADRFRAAPTDQHGRFELKGIPPGEYCAIALAEADPETWLEPGLFAPFEKSCSPVTVPPKGRVSFALQLTEAGR